LTCLKFNRFYGLLER